MNRDDLLKMLDLGGKEAEPVGPTELAVTQQQTQPPNGASPTALELDGWALRKGQEVLAESERLQALDLGEHAVADFHASAFLPDAKLVGRCADALRRHFLEQLFRTPEFRSLRATTRLREVPSVIAAVAFAEQFARLKQQEEEKPETEMADREMDTLRAVGRALTEASKEVSEAEEGFSALGLGPGAPGSNDPRAVAALYRRLRHDRTLQRICTLAGRFRRVAQSRQRQKVTHGMDDVVGVTLGGDLSRLLPVELAKLSVPELELDTLRRLIERQCMCREQRSMEPVGKGPIIVVVDESGSMHGEKVETAKALSLALVVGHYSSVG